MCAEDSSHPGADLPPEHNPGPADGLPGRDVLAEGGAPALEPFQVIGLSAHPLGRVRGSSTSVP
jgi:hypothetical protein